MNQILNEVLKDVSPTTENLEFIKNSLKEFLNKFEKNLEKLKANAEVFLGGSYAKNTMIRKKNYDIDIFVRFKDTQRGHENPQAGGKDISKITERALKEFGAKIIHGSRDYFQVTITKDIFFEIIPVKKVAKPKDAENITDLSYSHVRYIRKRVKTEKLLDEIRLAKVFCYANNFYGAESYINGFSGYAIELLVYYYKSFLKFIRAMSKIEDKTVIDIEKLHKNKSYVLMDLNSSKLISPIILIDPTYKQRNVAAALSEDTFKNFQKVCKKFLRNPSINFFELQEIDFEKLKTNAEKKGFEYILLGVKTNRQAGDIAGSKLLKFYKYLSEEMTRFFEIKNREFDYNETKTAKYFFAVQNKKEILITGPSTKDKKNVANFKKKHKKVFMKKGRVYSKEKIDLKIKEFIKKWVSKNSRIMKEMGIEKLKIEG